MHDREKVIKGLTIERECVARDCDRNCADCDLVQDRDWLLSVYDDALALLKEQDSCENCAIAIEDRQLVIRCKDCKYYNSKPDSHGDRCDKIHWSRNDDWFCADGRRKEQT